MEMASSVLNAGSGVGSYPYSPEKKSIFSTKKAPQGFLAFLSFNLAYNFNSNF